MNFLSFRPGLVAATASALTPQLPDLSRGKSGYHPEVILAGHRINDGMGQRVARECVRELLRRKAKASHRSCLDGGWPLIQKLLTNSSGLVLDVKTKLDRASKPAGVLIFLSN